MTDEVSRTLAEALELAEAWGLTRFELREGGQARFPAFTLDEVAALEAARARGARITAVSPGLLKGPLGDEAKLRRELDDTLPRSVELAVRLGCPLLIVFGFERADGETERDRAAVLRAFERAAEAAAEAGLRVAVENEPHFWADRPPDVAALIEELGHPAFGANWDPANQHWGGHRPTYDDFQTIRPYLFNLHVKDYYPDDPAAPWRPVGQGVTPWSDLLAWAHAETRLAHVTLETHCLPLAESSRQSLDWMRERLAALAETEARP